LVERIGRWRINKDRGFEPGRARGDRKSPVEIFVPSGENLLMSHRAKAKKANFTSRTHTIPPHPPF